MLSSVTGTPVTYNRTNGKIPQRKLWQKDSATLETDDTSWNKYQGINRDEKWDGIESPQFVDFSNLPDAGDSFFNKVTVIVSTPKPNFELSSTAPNEETLITSLDNFSLSEIKNETPDITVRHMSEDKNKEQYIVHDAGTIQVENKVNDPKWNKVKKPQSTAVHPFTFDLREKYRQEHKQERIKMLLEEEKKMRVFRANPVPKFLKTHTTSQNPNNNQNNNNNIDNNKHCNSHHNNHNNNKENNSDNKNQRAEKTNFTDKRTKKNTETWKKPPFLPCLARKNMGVSKAPRLHSEIRAEKRREFDMAVQEKERKKEEMRQMEIAIKNKEEEEQIARLRKQTVHKAQPIRKYKGGLPQIQKRPLTEPLSPILLKRRRFV